MGQLTANTPKPLLDCGGRPFLAWILRELSRFGIEEVVLLAGYQSERIDEFCRQVPLWLPKPLSIQVSVEPSRAGTGGAVWYARDLLKDTFLLINGDSWIDANLARFLAAAGAAPEAAGCVLLRAMEDCTRYGTVELQGNSITAFREKASVRAPGLINCGIYVLDKSALSMLSPNCSMELDILPALAAKRLLTGHVLDGAFIDIGIPADYARAREELPRCLMRPAIFFDRDSVLNEDLGRVGNKDRFQWLPGAREAVRFVNDAGFHALVVTNQAGVARGLYSEADIESLHRHMIQDLLAEGATIDDFRYCLFHPAGVMEIYRRDSSWRKPAHGMILDLLARWSIEGRRSILVGDKESDIETARAAGVKGYFYPGGNFLEFVEPLVTQLRRVAVGAPSPVSDARATGSDCPCCPRKYR
jgi:D-glycero-D-manno-heptose 1,7-bisphosphate phosphatase